MREHNADRLSCDIFIVSLSMSESADNSSTRWPDLSRPIKSFSIHTQAHYMHTIINTPSAHQI